MSIQVPAINISSDTFLTLFSRVNSVIDVLAGNAVTMDLSANGSLTTGNGYANGILGVLTLGVGTLRGGNVQSANVLTISSNASIGNSTSNVVVTTTGSILISGALLANSTQVGLATAYLVPGALLVGNSTVNSTVNSTALAFNGAAALSTAGYSVGNVSISTSAITVGNSTVNTVVGNAYITMGPGSLTINTGWVGVGNSYMTNTLVGVGSNVVVTSTQFFAGNSTVNAYLSSTGVYVGGSGATLGYAGGGFLLSLGSNVSIYSSGNASFSGYGSFGANLTVTAPEIILVGSQRRIVNGNYGVIQRFDGANYWVLFTNTADQYGNFNGLRPLQINAANGQVTAANGLVVGAGNLIINGYTITGGAANADVQAGSNTTMFVTPAALLGAMAFFTITYAATITINHQQGTNQTVTLTGNPAFAAPTNARVGWPLNVIVTQDATGTRVPTWNAAFDFADYGTPTGSTGANQSDLYTFLCTGASKFAFLGIRRNI